MTQPAPEPTNANQGRRTLGIVFLTLFLDLVGFSIIFPLFPAMLDYYLPLGAGSDSLLGQLVGPLHEWAVRSGAENPALMTAVLFGGILGSLYSLLQFLCAPLWGAYSDRVGRRKVLLITIAGLALSYVAWFVAASFWVLVLARVIGGIMGGNRWRRRPWPTSPRARNAPRWRSWVLPSAWALSLARNRRAFAGINLADSFPALATFGVNPFSMPALVSLVLTLLNLVWVVRRFEETLPESKRGTNTASKERLPIFHLFQHGGAAVKRTNLIYLIYMLAFSGMEFTLTFLAVERLGFSPAQNGGMFVFIGFVLVLVQGGFVRRMAPQLGEKKLAVAGLLCGVVAFLILSIALKLGIFFTALGVMALSIGLVSPTMSALVSLYSTESEQGKVLGVFRSAGSLARAIGPLMAAFVYFSYGSQSAYLFGAVIVILPFVLALSLPKPGQENVEH